MNLNERKLAEGILFTDMYQLTMAQLYYRTGMQDKQVQFDHYFREYPGLWLAQSGVLHQCRLGMADGLDAGNSLPRGRSASICAASSLELARSYLQMISWTG